MQSPAPGKPGACPPSHVRMMGALVRLHSEEALFGCFVYGPIGDYVYISDTGGTCIGIHAQKVEKSMETFQLLKTLSPNQFVWYLDAKSKGRLGRYLG